MAVSATPTTLSWRPVDDNNINDLFAHRSSISTTRPFRQLSNVVCSSSLKFRSSSSSSSPSKIPHSSLYRGVAFSEFDAIFSQLHYLLRICFRDDSGKVRMKPRDPHRAMHSKSLQKPIYVGLDQLVSNLPTVEGIKRNPKQDDPKVLSLKPLLAPNIAWQFTKNLKNIVDIMSVSQTTVSDSV